MIDHRESRPYAVVCQRFDGTERTWQSYPNRDEADRVAQALVAVGCPARVSGPDEPAPVEG